MNFYTVTDLGSNQRIILNPQQISAIRPFDGASQVTIGTNQFTISNDALAAMFQHAEIPLNEISEPQIAGVTDTDIVDNSQPVTFEEVNDEDVIDNTPSEPVTIDAEATYVNQD